MGQSKRGRILWFVGLSGAGKSTLCRSLESELNRRGESVLILDGDHIRQGLCADLGFRESERAENIRRIAHVADLVANTGTTVLVATISPLQRLRDLSRSIVPDVLEIFVDAPLTVCENRDPKGLYKRARAGHIVGFTGIDSPFELPRYANAICRTHQRSVDECCQELLNLLSDTPPLGDDRGAVTRRPTLAVDFDGVIAEHDGWKGPGHYGAPRPDVIAALCELKEDNWKIIVHTTRRGEDVRPYLQLAGIPHDEININSDYPDCVHKPVASVYWDDRALTYSGDARRDLRLIRSFRTWNGRK